jgi:hypothetical protein
MYRGVAGGTANIVAEAASRDDKVRFVLKNCIKDAELPTSLF